MQLPESVNGEPVLHSEESTSSDSQTNRQEKLCGFMDELCHFFDAK